MYSSVKDLGKLMSLIFRDRTEFKANSTQILDTVREVWRPRPPLHFLIVHTRIVRVRSLSMGLYEEGVQRKH